MNAPRDTCHRGTGAQGRSSGCQGRSACGPCSALCIGPWARQGLHPGEARQAGAARQGGTGGLQARLSRTSKVILVARAPTQVSNRVGPLSDLSRAPRAGSLSAHYPTTYAYTHLLTPCGLTCSWCPQTGCGRKGMCEVRARQLCQKKKVQETHWFALRNPAPCIVSLLYRLQHGTGPRPTPATTQPAMPGLLSQCACLLTLFPATDTTVSRLQHALMQGRPRCSKP